MARRRLFVALLWPTALVVLVGVLALFEYQWLGQVSEADRARQRASLDQRARAFAADFDREIGRAAAALQLDGGGAAGESDEAEAARKLAAWKQSAAFPQMIRDVYLTSESSGTSEDAPVGLARLDPAAGTFAAVSWPPELTAIRDRITISRHRFSAPVTPFSSTPGATFRFIAVGQSPLYPSIPALVVASQTVQQFSSLGAPAKEVVRVDFEPRYLIAVLDKTVLAGALLPALVDKHLAVDDYRVEVLDTTSGGAPVPIFTRGLAAGASIDARQADAAMAFFSVRSDSLREALQIIRPDTDAGVAAAGAAGTMIAAPVAGGMAVSMQEREMRETAAHLSAVESGRARVESNMVNGLRSTFVMSGAGGRGGSSTTQTNVLFGPGAWEVVLQHPAGSLDAAVNKARRRNLAMSFGVLAVLSVSVVLISINAQRAERLAAQQMDFVATVSHELRTPLAVIRSAAQNLSAGVVHDASQTRRYGELIDTEGRRLTDMVEQVLEFAGIAGGRRQFTPAPADVAALTGDVLASCGALVRDAGFTLELHAGTDVPPVALDEPAFRRALSNLIANALKYAGDGRWIGVRVERYGAREVAVSVSDRGRGIDAADVPHIFDAFYRGREAKDRQIHGNGLGLSLVKSIVTAHGGHVTVKSAPGQGATFTMSFPVARNERDDDRRGDQAR